MTQIWDKYLKFGRYLTCGSKSPVSDYLCGSGFQFSESINSGTVEEYQGTFHTSHTIIALSHSNLYIARKTMAKLFSKQGGVSQNILLTMV
jgi:hypothetical protein